MIAIILSPSCSFYLICSSLPSSYSLLAPPPPRFPPSPPPRFSFPPPPPPPSSLPSLHIIPLSQRLLLLPPSISISSSTPILLHPSLPQYPFRSASAVASTSSQETDALFRK